MARFPGLPLIGASPDAILRWPDGTVEVIEVKTHAPFAKDGIESSLAPLS